ncbi:MAG: ParB N-terminal domain-containing protein [Planctomycetes bacterium]|nr:ParB N-terminal domain-containing protein [Planctomycetota bacterium]
MSKKINFFKENGVTYANVSDLFLYKDNPRDVEAKDFERLIEQIKLGEHSTLLVTTEGEVLGGNTRLRAYQKLGKERAKVVVVSIVETSAGVHIVIDDKKSERTFDSVDQAKIELALSHNDSIGTNNELKLAELMTLNKVNTEVYSVATKITPVSEIVNRLSPSEDEDASQELNADDYLNEDKDVINCPRCEFEIPISEALIERVREIIKDREGN